VMLGPSMEEAIRWRDFTSGGVRGDNVCWMAAPRCGAKHNYNGVQEIV
jgi:hypothetical protein